MERTILSMSMSFPAICVLSTIMKKDNHIAMALIGDMAFDVTNGALSQTLSVQLNNLEHLLIHGKHKGVRFYYDQTSGGNVLTVMAKSVIGGAVSELSNLAKNTFKDLLWKDPKKEGVSSGWSFDRSKAIKTEVDKEYGKFPVNGGGAFVYAVDHQGYRCRDALMMGIPLDDDKKIVVKQEYRNDYLIADFRSGEKREQVYTKNEVNQCDHLVFFDCAAIVNVDSQKSLVITQVQGRDYSCKELVSNGDVNIQVNGCITSLYPDVYPTEEVKKLRQILRYKGVIEVNNIILDNWNIEKIIIKDFNFPQEEGGKAMQRYSFTAVAVQPVTLSEVKEDNIGIITQPFDVEPKPENKWKDMLEKQLDRLKQSAGSLADVGLSQGGDLLNNTLNNL